MDKIKQTYCSYYLTFNKKINRNDKKISRREIILFNIAQETATPISTLLIKVINIILLEQI